MTKTLYKQLRSYEKTFDGILSIFETNMLKHPEKTEDKKFEQVKIEYSNLQKDLENLSEKTYQLVIKCYNNNQVLKDAIEGRVTISESLEDLLNTNKGFKRILFKNTDNIYLRRSNNLKQLIKLDKPEQAKYLDDKIIQYYK